MESKKKFQWFQNSELQNYSKDFQELMHSIAIQINKTGRRNKQNKKCEVLNGNAKARTHQLRTPRHSFRNNVKYVINSIQTQLVVKRKTLQLPCLKQCSYSKQYLNDSPRVFVKRSTKRSCKLKINQKNRNESSHQLKFSLRKDSIFREEQNDKQKSNAKLNCKHSPKLTQPSQLSNIYKLSPWQISEV